MSPEELRQEILTGISLLEEIVADLVASIGPPLAVVRPHGVDFQYAKSTPEVVQILKAIRVVSGLDACCVLLESGHTSESASLARMIQDALHEIMFLIERDGEGKLPGPQQQFVDEFFNQPPPVPEKLEEGLRKPPTVPKKKVLASLARLYGSVSNGDTSTVQRMSQNMDIVASGYVHCSYRSVMETYKGSTSQEQEGFSMRGLAGTIRVYEHTRFIAGLAFSALAAIGSVAILFGKREWYPRTGPAMDHLWAAMETFDWERGKLPPDEGDGQRRC